MSEFDDLFRNLDTGRRGRGGPNSGRKTRKRPSPVWGVLPKRGHRRPAFKRFQGGPDIWRGRGVLTEAADGVSRSLQMLRAMATQPKAWWARFDLRDATGMPYNSVKAIVRRLEIRGLVERRAVNEGRVNRQGGPGRAEVRFRMTDAGRWLVRLCE